MYNRDKIRPSFKEINDHRFIYKTCSSYYRHNRTILLKSNLLKSLAQCTFTNIKQNLIFFKDG